MVDQRGSCGEWGGGRKRAHVRHTFSADAQARASVLIPSLGVPSRSPPHPPPQLVITDGGATLTSAPGGGLTVSSHAPTSGTHPSLGPYTGTTTAWNGGRYVTNVLNFGPSTLLQLVYSQGANGTALGKSHPADEEFSSAFPVFTEPTGSPPRGFLAWAGCMSPGVTGTFKPGTPSGGSAFSREGGIAAVYNSTGHTLVVSAAANFMVTKLGYAAQTLQTFGCGLNGMVDGVPAGFVHSTLLTGGAGINATVYAHGAALLSLGGKTRTAPEADLSLSSLGLGTDNGAYYYYWSGSNSSTYEDVLPGILAYMRSLKLPMRYAFWDSWWYWKDGACGVSLTVMMRWALQP